MKKADRTRQMIIEKAADVFNEKGFAGTSIDDVLRVSSVAKGCLYGHFNSKDELSYAAVDYLMEKITAQRTFLLAKQKTAVGKIHAFMDMNKNPLNYYVDGGCPVVNFSTEVDDTNMVIKGKLKLMINNSIELLTSILEHGVQEGEFSANLVPKQFATKLFMAIEGACALCRILDSVKPMHVCIKGFKDELKGFTAPH
jgi:TetR/AcrR family transcriptional repressor of nem operon